MLETWRETATKQAIVEFVERVTTEGGADYVPPSERIAVFDNGGTLWCEKPMPVELGFILRRLAEMAQADGSLRDRQPWKAAHERDYAWIGEAVTKHYAGDESDAQLLLGGMLQAFAGKTVDEYAEAAYAYLCQGQHPTLGRGFRELGYVPMVELLRYLEASGFLNFIISGGDRDFMRPVTEEMYGVPSQRVVGSSSGLRYSSENGGSIAYLAELEVFDDGPAKPVRIWSRIGRRPILAAGNSNGDIHMLEYAGGPRPALRLLVNHDDAEREFAYTAGAEASLEQAQAEGWTVVSMKADWA